MTGWIIYSKKDIQKNKSFVQMFKEGFDKKGIQLKLIIVEEVDIKKLDVPDFAINRSRDYKIAEALEEQGVRVFNSAKVTKIANDKASTYEFLKDVVPFMPVICEGERIISDFYKNDEKEFEYPYVIKSCKGHGGDQVYMVKNSCEKCDVIKQLNEERYLVQKLCSDLGKDVRVYILGNEIVEAVLRTSKDSFKSNYSLGGSVESYELSPPERDMVFAIIEKLPLDYAGIDFTFHEGRAVFNEIEDAVGARMLYATSGTDIVSLYVEYILNTIE